ncbi:Major facilitator superfamily MFS-1 [Mycena kentingensis (nom. inval.)]|nr:Major facilitator superfamily MFS-1 [Mycena kentingensis (nom. inval.)]
MSKLQAPYTDAMRLGMGFNSFTQQLCINDAVRVVQGNVNVPATEGTLRTVPLSAPTSTASSTAPRVSQDVVWTAKFVTKVSEIVDTLNVSGSLQIKCDAIGGSGKASATFVDTNKIKESDINYLISAKVVNQRLEAPDLTQFAPLANVPASEFTNVYGDSFISGFLEGGEFNALISIKAKEKSAVQKIMGQLQVNLAFAGGAVQVAGTAAGGKDSVNTKIDGETTISVSWKGGGDIQGSETTDWTLETLKKVAIAFPQKVLNCPIRTHAILTEYSDLKSFHTSTTVKGSPLDYENAGVYSSELLDMYLEYKEIARGIRQALLGVEQEQVTLKAQPTKEEFKTRAAKAMEDYNKRLQAYQASPPAGSSPPMPPNAIKPYDPSIFGLEEASTDCRFEMIKIVREVDAVAQDPRIAAQNRPYQYLQPMVFRMLVPIAT